MALVLVLTGCAVAMAICAGWMALQGPILSVAPEALDLAQCKMVFGGALVGSLTLKAMVRTAAKILILADQALANLPCFTDYNVQSLLLAEEARNDVCLWHRRVLASEEDLHAAVLAESADEVGSPISTSSTLTIQIGAEICQAEDCNSVMDSLTYMDFVA